MSETDELARGIADGVRACAEAAHRLREAGVKAEELAEYSPARRRLMVFTQKATMRPIGRVWRIGALLLSTDFTSNADSTSNAVHEGSPGLLFAVGRTTRAANRGRVGYQSVSREERRDIAAAALRGGYPEGTPVNFDATPLPLTREALERLGPDSPIGWSRGAIRVRWRPGASLESAPTLRGYFDERVSLLINPEP